MASLRSSHSSSRLVEFFEQLLPFVDRQRLGFLALGRHAAQPVADLLLVRLDLLDGR